MAALWHTIVEEGYGVHVSISLQDTEESIDAIYMVDFHAMSKYTSIILDVLLAQLFDKIFLIRIRRSYLL